MSDVTKLPQWAQHKLRNLQGMVDALEERLLILHGGFKSRTRVVDYVQDEMHLPDDTRVRFFFSDDFESHDWLDVFRSDDGVEIRTGWGALNVRPICANVVNVEVRK